jgi:peptide/nickel transport system substrate-binding protein
MGPFVLERYDPGQRLVFHRNAHYWRRSPDGRTLPTVDRIVLDVVPDQEAELLKISSGDLDFTQSEMRPADYAILKRAENAGRVSVSDLGVGLDGDLLWFNQTPRKRGDTRARWLDEAVFHRAILQAVDRSRFVDAVYFGDAVPASGIVSPGNRTWHADVPMPEYDPAAAQRALRSIGLTATDRDGQLADSAGHDVRFTLLTQKGNTSLERGAEFIRTSLQAIGIHVDVVALEVGSLVERFTSGDYEAVYFRLLTTDTDPALNLDFWLSSGSAHVWNPEQHSPAAGWEQQIDRLMNEVATSADQSRRQALFADVQRLFARELPAMAFAFPRLRMALNRRIAGATPVPFRPPVLWNPAVLSVRPAGA